MTKRKKAVQHTRKLKSGKVVVVNKGVAKTTPAEYKRWQGKNVYNEDFPGQYAKTMAENSAKRNLEKEATEYALKIRDGQRDGYHPAGSVASLKDFYKGHNKSKPKADAYKKPKTLQEAWDKFSYHNAERIKAIQNKDKAGINKHHKLGNKYAEDHASMGDKVVKKRKKEFYKNYPGPKYD